jgi:hypothetical protein
MSSNDHLNNCPTTINNRYTAKGKKRKESDREGQTLPLQKHGSHFFNVASSSRTLSTSPANGQNNPSVSSIDLSTDEVNIDSDNSVFQVTPFGLYCLICKKKISADHSTNFSRHVKRFHAGYSGKTFQELQLEVQRISNSPMNDYCCVDTQKMMISCGVCDEIFSRLLRSTTKAQP